MIEETIAQHIADNSSFETGSDIFLSTLPREDREGISVKYVRQIGDFGNYKQTFIGILIQYKDYTVARDNRDTIVGVITKRGFLGVSWGIVGEITTNNYGLDEYGRYNLGISAIVAHT